MNNMTSQIETENDIYDELAGKYEFDAGKCRVEAESLAMADMQQFRKQKRDKTGKSSCKDKIDYIFEFILEKTAPIYNSKPLHQYLPTDIDQCSAFDDYFSQYVKYNGASSFLAFFDKEGKWLRGEIAEAVVTRLLKWLAKQRFDFREVSTDTEMKKYAREAQSSRGITHIFEMLKKASGLKALPDEFDREKHMLNCCGIAVDLKTGEQRNATPEDMFTKSIRCKPLDSHKNLGNPCPAFKKFIDSILCDKSELSEFLITFLGYSLTGEMKEQKALFILGLTGANGKGTLFNLLKSLLGEYCIELPDSVIFDTKNEGKFEFAELEGSRLAIKSDVPKGRIINSGSFKTITGCDSNLMAQKKFRDPFTFTPQCKLIICCNNKPRLRETGGAMERRIALIPFEADFRKNPNKDLLDELHEELPAILTILIEAAGRWYKEGLPECTIVKDASREYMKDEDLIEQFFDEKCKTDDSTARVEGKILLDKFSEYCGKKVNKKTFKEGMESKGFKIVQFGNGGMRGKRGYEGICLLSENISM